jgi:RNA polymerase sigma-32 factor
VPGDASLDAPIDDGEGRQTSWLDRFSSDEPSAEDLLAAAFARAAAEDEVDDALRELDRRERLIVESRAMSDEPLTLAEIGERLGCSRERVRQLQTRAHEKLRRRILERRAS